MARAQVKLRAEQSWSCCSEGRQTRHLSRAPFSSEPKDFSWLLAWREGDSSPFGPRPGLRRRSVPVHRRWYPRSASRRTTSRRLRIAGAFGTRCLSATCLSRLHPPFIARPTPAFFRPPSRTPDLFARSPLVPTQCPRAAADSSIKRKVSATPVPPPPTQLGRVRLFNRLCLPGRVLVRTSPIGPNAVESDTYCRGTCNCKPRQETSPGGPDDASVPGPVPPELGGSPAAG